MPVTPDALFDRFAELGIAVERHNHPPLHTVEESQSLRGEIPGGHCKSLFLKDKKGALWLVVTLEETPIDLKALPKHIGSARLSFGKPDLLYETLGVLPGAVTPFALINDTDLMVNVVLDAAMMEQDLLNYHPLVNTTTVTIARDDVLKFIAACGHKPDIVALG
ncbi:MAG: prolyl-tRNA synthetase associated domain-containing protein [Pseudomonadota bacterium]